VALRFADLTSKWWHDIHRRMPKKRAKPTSRPATSLRFDDETEQAEFKRAAKLDGFNTVSGWIMFYMRRRKAEVLKGQG
jgi:hypothetical protein